MKAAQAVLGGEARDSEPAKRFIQGGLLFSLHAWARRAVFGMMIAATAQKHDLTLVTRNTRDFQYCGIALLNPFTD